MRPFGDSFNIRLPIESKRFGRESNQSLEGNAPSMIPLHHRCTRLEIPGHIGKNSREVPGVVPFMAPFLQGGPTPNRLRTGRVKAGRP